MTLPVNAKRIQDLRQMQCENVHTYANILARTNTYTNTHAIYCSVIVHSDKKLQCIEKRLSMLFVADLYENL